MLTGKFIFVILKKRIYIFAKKVFLVLSGENVILPLLATLKKHCWHTPRKFHYRSLLGKNPYGVY